MKSSTLIVLLYFSLFSITASAEPPYATSLNLGTEIITEYDTTTFVDSAYEGIFEHYSWVEDAFIFTANYNWSSGHSIEFQIDPAFGSMEASSTQVGILAPIFGRLPFSFLKEITEVQVHAGRGTFAGGSLTGGGGVVWVYAESAEAYIEYGTIEEFLLHEASHVFFDKRLRDDEDWLQAKAADVEFISTRARDFPFSEDQAESGVAYIALRARKDRISEVDADLVANTIPNRIAYIDSLNLNLEPLIEYEFQINAGLNDAWYNPATSGQGFFITVFPDLNYVSLAWFTYDTELPPIDATSNLGDAGHRWLTGVGLIEGNQVLMNIEMTSGGLFDTATVIERTDPPGSDGTITLTFDGCNSGTIEYDITSINRQGIVPIQRVAGDNIALCEALNSN